MIPVANVRKLYNYIEFSFLLCYIIETELIQLEIKTGYLYHIKDEFFQLINDKELMINHENGHSRPSYLAIKDNDLLWFIPLSTKIDKYQKIIEKKEKKYGKCKSIIIRKIAGVEEAILIQNAFPILEKYIKSVHTIDGRIIRVSTHLQKEILDDFKYMLSLKKNGRDLFFTDIDRIKEILDNMV